MEELNFNSFDEAMSYLADISQSQIKVAGKKKVEYPRGKPKNNVEKRNWNKSEMWGDPKNHKYPLFDNKTGKLSAKRAKSAIRYLNMPRSKQSYPNNKDRARVLSKAIKVVLKLEPDAKIKYQSQDPMYDALPVSLKKKLDGYGEKKGKKASEGGTMDLFQLDRALRIATEDKSVNNAKKNLQKVRDKINTNVLQRKISSIGLTQADINTKRIIDLIDMLSLAISENGEEEPMPELELTEEDVQLASKIAAKDFDRMQIIKDLMKNKTKMTDQALKKPAKIVLETNSLGGMRVHELLSKLISYLDNVKDEGDEPEPEATPA